MIASLNQIAPRLKKLLLMLSSERDGEIAGLLTTRAATQSARDGNDHDLDRHAMREFCLQHLHLLRPREHEFISSLGGWRGPLTEKQSAWLSSIYARVRRAAA